MLYLEYDDKTWAVDIETDGLRPTLVWVLCASNMMTGEEVTLTDMEEMGQWIDDRKAEGCKFVFHNGLHFDGPVLNALCGTKLSVTCIIDTMMLSSLWNPSLPGGHSLAAWGDRLKFPKQEHDEWHVFSPEMVTRCQSDVEITKRLYGYLCRKMMAIGFSEDGIALEHHAWTIVREQRMNGFAFDFARAERFREDLLDHARSLNDMLQRHFPPELLYVRTYGSRFKKDGSFTENYKRHAAEYPKIVDNDDGTYDVWDWHEFEPGSPDQRRDKLLALGWVPQEFTKPSKSHPNGQAQPTRKGKLSPSLQAFVDDMAEKGIDNGVTTLAAWMVVNSRASMVKTWMNSYNEHTGCIHGQLWLANTLRYKHSDPNTANAPSVKEGEEKDETGKVVKKWVIRGEKGGWAYESRDLWETRDREKRRLMGVDAKGIQLRVLAHYLNDDEFTRAILSEDPHAANAKMMGLGSRSLAKTITYAIVMGAGDQRVATEARISLEEAKANKELFFNKVPGLKKLIRRLKAEQRKDGRITLCDGSRILCEEPHTVIPYLLQGDESRIMKRAKVIARRMIRAQKLDVLWVGDIHDEWQCDVALEDVEAFREVCIVAFREAGEYYDYNLPIDCDVKVGFTWAETH